jgi:hypothetical protein
MMLVDFGVPFEVALSLDDYERIGLIVIFGEIKGGIFEWDRMGWRTKNNGVQSE